MLVGLASEELDHRHALDRLLEERIQASEPPAHLAIGVARPHPEPGGDGGQHRHQRERDEGQAPVEPQHRADDGHERDDVADDGEEPARERLVDGLHVVEHASHQTPDGIPVVERGVQAQQVAKDGRAEVVHHALAGQVHQVRLHRPQDREHGQGRQEERGHAGEAGPVGAQDVIVDRDLHEERLHELERGDQREEHAGGSDQPVVRPGDPGQATDEPSIEGATEDLVVLDVTHRRSPPRAAGCARAERTRRRL